MQRSNSLHEFAERKFGTHCVYLSSNDNQDYFGYLFSVIKSLY